MSKLPLLLCFLISSWLAPPPRTCKEILWGQILDSSTKNPISFVNISLTRRGDERTEYQSDYEGRIMWSGLCKAQYLAVFSAPGFVSDSMTISFPRERKLEVYLDPID
jgi:hypothetical protein